MKFIINSYIVERMWLSLYLLGLGQSIAKTLAGKYLRLVESGAVLVVQQHVLVFITHTPHYEVNFILAISAVILPHLLVFANFAFFFILCLLLYWPTKWYPVYAIKVLSCRVANTSRGSIGALVHVYGYPYLVQLRCHVYPSTLCWRIARI